MIFCKPGRSGQGQRGFTLVEVLVTLAITGLIGLGAATASLLVLGQGTRNSDYITASQHTTNAIYWISRDAQMSQTIVPGVANGFPLTMDRTEWDNSVHQVIYHFDDDRLFRSYSIDSGEPLNTLTAQYINTTSENTICAFADRVLTVKVTATVGEGTHAINVTKEREIVPRPGL